MFHRTLPGVLYAHILRPRGVRVRWTNHAATKGLVWRSFHQTSFLRVVQPYLLADIGEGITECQIVSWSVRPGDHVREFDHICEVQSDKASVEITSRFDGIIKKLHYEVDEMALVGKPLIDIDIQYAEPVETTTEDAAEQQADISPSGELLGSHGVTSFAEVSVPPSSSEAPGGAHEVSRQDHDILPPELIFEAIPAVRRMFKEHKIDVMHVQGTGRGGRITKEDVQRHIARAPNKSSQDRSSNIANAPKQQQSTQQDRLLPMNAVEKQMFKAMTQSLTIPHFQYTQRVDITDLVALVKNFSTNRTLSALLAVPTDLSASVTKLTILPFVMKALSHVFMQSPKLNAHLSTNDHQPQLTQKGPHNFGFAVDTPNGLVVPVIHNVQSHTVMSLASEIQRLGKTAREGNLTPDDMQGATFTISNIGSIGGDVVNPIIVAPMVGIMAVGRVYDALSLDVDGNGIEKLTKRRQVVLSWSADHRVVDGATVAKAAESLHSFLKTPQALALVLW